MLLLDGKIIKESAVPHLRRRIKELGFTPVLGIVKIGDNERSQSYISQKQKFAEEIGVHVELVSFNADVPLDEVLYEIERLNSESSVNGIIVQFPLPKQLDRRVIIETIEPNKDVDGLTALNLKSLLENDHQGFVPATAKGILLLLDYYSVVIEGKQVVVVGRSLLAGKSTALALLNRNATVTICHRFTQDLPRITKQADILISAVGKPALIRSEHVSAQQTIVDVGISLEGGALVSEEHKATRLMGDVDFESVKGIVGALSPVPGGVGPMTVLSLFENLIEAAGRQVRWTQ